MRVLLATTAGAGHFGPMLPFGHALRDAGHEVGVAAPASFAQNVERTGYPHLPFGDGDPAELGAVFARLPELSWDEANATVIREVFGRIDTTAALAGMEAAVREWRPDLILREGAEFSSYLVAEAAGVPHVLVSIGLASFSEMAFPRVESALVALGAAPGLPNLFSQATLSLVPLSFEDPDAPGRGDVRRYRDEAVGNAGSPAPLPGWWPDHENAPLVYVTFGSVAGSLGHFGGIYRSAVDALADLPIRVLLTVGDGGDAGGLAPLPPNVHVERWWPQAEVMPHAAAMVGHGGFGTTMTGLVAGVPQVVVPLFADQPFNARRVAAVGAGVALEGGPAAIEGLAGAVQRVLDDESIHVGAKRIAGEVAGMPPASACVPVLESVAGRS